MSVCLETSSVLASSVGTSSSVSSQLLVEQTSSNTQTVVSAIANQPSINTNIKQPAVSANVVQLSNEKPEQQLHATKSIAKLVVASHSSTGQCLQKVVNPPLITVLNPSGPLTVVKTLCVTSGVSSTPQFTLVNSAPLNVTNAVGKSPTITLLNAPVTVVKAITGQTVEKNVTDIVSNSGSATIPAIIENRGHNVFVKNTCPDSTVPDIPQSHKLLTASNFPHTNVITNVSTQAKTVNGQRSKLKILSNMVLPGSSQTSNNIILNKPSTTQRCMPRQKLIGPNGAPAKYLNKPSPNNVVKPSNINPALKLMQDKSPTRMIYPTHKSQIKTIPPVNNYVVPKLQQGIKTLSPQHKNIPGQVQRTGSGLRTIPPQRPQKISASANKPNYIGKHAAQAQKMRHPSAHGKVKLTGAAGKVPYNVHGPPPSAPPPPDKQLTELTFNQALTAQIIETLSNNSAPMSSSRYEILPTRYDHAFSCPDSKQSVESPKVEDKTKSGLDALSLICQAVLLDHNYNATLPPDSPTRPSPPINITSQVNGMSTTTSVYSPGNGKRRPLPSSNTLSSTSTISNMSVASSNNNNSLPLRDDDAASDISDGSERKHDTEGEETDTAPEAEAVNNENFDGYGDYVTRCICGFLHDDGYMVECDRCKVWQHVQCVVKNRQVPDEFLCEVCDPAKPVDRQKARAIQQQWLRDRQFQDPKLRKDIKVKEVFKPKETISDTDSSDNEQVSAVNNVVNKGRALANRRKSDIHQKPISRHRREVAKEVVQRRQKRRERKIVKKKPKLPPKSHSDDENQDNWASHLPQLRQWIERYEEAVTNHYSPELRARISSIRVNGVHSDINVHFDATVHKCRVHTQPLTEIKYLVSTVHLGPNTPVIELRGKYMLSTQHRNAGGSLTTRQHSQRPGPFLFFYRLHKDNTEVCVDTRTYGNSARFIRRSCKPNAELRHCIEKGVLHLYIVSITTVDKNCELTIKHESHDLAAIGTTHIACACGNSDDCAVNKTTTIKKNGETSEINRKRRSRRTVSSNVPEPEIPKPVKDEPPVSPPLASVPSPPPPPPELVHSPVKVKQQPEVVEKLEPVEVKVELEVEKPKMELKKEEMKEELVDIIKEQVEELTEEVQEVKVKEEVVKSPPGTPITTRRSSHYKSDKEDEKSESKGAKVKCKKLSREERKLEAILRAIEQMEKAESRKQEHQAKQAHRRESEPGVNPKEEEKTEPKIKRRRRKGRSRTVSQSARRNRLNSTDSYVTSGDENMLSPSDSNPPPNKPSMNELTSDQNDNRAVGLLLALSNGDNSNKHEKSPTREVDSNSNSAHSSPETQLSSACLLVQAAVEPLESGFKFPKTKKGLMNEWLNKVPEPVQSASSISPSALTSHINNNSEDSNSFYATPTKNLAALAQAASYCDNVQSRGNAKKRWLRQAISEDHSCDSPLSRPESPPLNDMVAPPKKRRLPRESLSNNASPPTTPTGATPPLNKIDRERQEGCVEIVYSGTDGDSPTQTLESDAVLKERAAKMKQEFNIVPSTVENIHRNEMGPLGCLMDPRLSRENRIYHNADLVGTVEKTLSILGLDNTKSESTMPKRKVKLSITEYRQRKKLNINDKNDEPEQEPEQTSNEENNSSESFKATPRARSGSTSSSTSLTSSDDEIILPEITTKAPAFNSEPTELERQREISRLRLKKAFGLSIDEEPRPALDVEAILNLELEPKVKPIPLPSPTFPIPGSSELAAIREVPAIKQPSSPEALDIKPVDLDVPNPAPQPIAERSLMSCEMETEEIDVVEDPTSVKKEEQIEGGSEGDGDNRFYMPDDDNKVVPPVKVVFEETESVSYVPPFNNPVYPNENFTAYTSAIDDEARYEGRNPSPPPNMEPESFSNSQL